MKPNNILSASLIDLIFDGRNKEYGAYYLRTTYEQRIVKALIVTFSIVVLAAGGIALTGASKKSEPVYKVHDGLVITNLPPPKIVEPPPLKEKQKQQKVPMKTEIFVDIKMVDKEFIVPPPSQDNLALAKIGLEKIEGPIDNKLATSDIEVGVKKGVIQQKVEADPEPTLTIVQIEAKFPGDWVKFLVQNLDGETPVRNGAGEGRYTVVIQFVVDKEGNVSEIKPLTNHGFGLEAEAVRVLKKATRWEPAIQNGEKVKAYRRQTITFEVLD